MLIGACNPVAYAIHAFRAAKDGDFSKLPKHMIKGGKVFFTWA